MEGQHFQRCSADGHLTAATLNLPYFEAAAESVLARVVVIRIDIETLTAKRKKFDANGVEMKWGRME